MGPTFSFRFFWWIQNTKLEIYPQNSPYGRNSTMAHSFSVSQKRFQYAAKGKPYSNLRSLKLSQRTGDFLSDLQHHKVTNFLIKSSIDDIQTQFNMKSNKKIKSRLPNKKIENCWSHLLKINIHINIKIKSDTDCIIESENRNLKSDSPYCHIKSNKNIVLKKTRRYTLKRPCIHILQIYSKMTQKQTRT